MTEPEKSNRLPVGADIWIDKNPYNKKKGLKEHKKWNAEHSARVRKHKQQRAESGYSWDDWINFDSYIVPVIANALLDFAENGVGFFPMADEVMNADFTYDDSMQENHKATLGAMYYALSEYSKCDHTLMSTGEWAIRYAEAQEALHIFAENIGHWWD